MLSMFELQRRRDKQLELLLVLWPPTNLLRLRARVTDTQGDAHAVAHLQSDVVGEVFHLFDVRAAGARSSEGVAAQVVDALFAIVPKIWLDRVQRSAGAEDVHEEGDSLIVDI